MALTAVNTGDTFYPTVINQVINVLQRQTGQSDAGHYMIAGNNYTNTGLFQTCNALSRSRTTVPVSVSIDTADDTMTLLGSPAVGHITMGGCQIFSGATAAGGNAHGGGNATFNF